MFLRRHRNKDTEATVEGAPRRTWLQRVGLLGFLFFLVKGLLWLIVPALVVAWNSLKD